MQLFTSPLLTHARTRKTHKRQTAYVQSMLDISSPEASPASKKPSRKQSKSKVPSSSSSISRKKKKTPGVADPDLYTPIAPPNIVKTGICDTPRSAAPAAAAVGGDAGRKNKRERSPARGTNIAKPKPKPKSKSKSKPKPKPNSNLKQNTPKRNTVVFSVTPQCPDLYKPLQSSQGGASIVGQIATPPAAPGRGNKHLRGHLSPNSNLANFVGHTATPGTAAPGRGNKHLRGHLSPNSTLVHRRNQSTIGFARPQRMSSSPVRSDPRQTDPRQTKRFSSSAKRKGSAVDDMHGMKENIHSAAKSSARRHKRVQSVFARMEGSEGAARAKHGRTESTQLFAGDSVMPEMLREIYGTNNSPTPPSTPPSSDSSKCQEGSFFRENCDGRENLEMMEPLSPSNQIQDQDGRAPNFLASIKNNLSFQRKKSILERRPSLEHKIESKPSLFERLKVFEYSRVRRSVTENTGKALGFLNTFAFLSGVRGDIHFTTKVMEKEKQRRNSIIDADVARLHGDVEAGFTPDDSAAPLTSPVISPTFIAGDPSPADPTPRPSRGSRHVTMNGAVPAPSPCLHEVPITPGEYELPVAELEPPPQTRSTAEMIKMHFSWGRESKKYGHFPCKLCGVRKKASGIFKIYEESTDTKSSLAHNAVCIQRAHC